MDRASNLKPLYVATFYVAPLGWTLPDAPRQWHIRSTSLPLVKEAFRAWACARRGAGQAARQNLVAAVYVFDTAAASHQAVQSEGGLPATALVSWLALDEQHQVHVSS